MFSPEPLGPNLMKLSTDHSWVEGVRINGPTPSAMGQNIHVTKIFGPYISYFSLAYYT